MDAACHLDLGDLADIEEQLIPMDQPERGAGPAFAWQTGYGAFSVSHSNLGSVVKYIQAQEEHHRRVSFQEEFVTFLKKNGIRYDERYIWE